MELSYELVQIWLSRDQILQHLYQMQRHIKWILRNHDYLLWCDRLIMYGSDQTDL